MIFKHLHNVETRWYCPQTLNAGIKLASILNAETSYAMLADAEADGEPR